MSIDWKGVRPCHKRPGESAFIHTWISVKRVFMRTAGATIQLIWGDQEFRSCVCFMGYFIYLFVLTSNCLSSPTHSALHWPDDGIHNETIKNVTTIHDVAHCFILIVGSSLCFCNALLVQRGAADYAGLWPSTPSAQTVLIWQLLLWIQSPGHCCDASHI